MTFVQLVLSGLALGAAYALVALGFVFIVNATGAVNFAQGDFVMAGGYAAILLTSIFSIPVVLLLPLVAIITFLMGVLLVAFSPAWAGIPTCDSISCDGDTDDFTAVPEPGSLVLLTAGLGGLAWSLRRRR